MAAHRAKPCCREALNVFDMICRENSQHGKPFGSGQNATQWESLSAAGVESSNLCHRYLVGEAQCLSSTKDIITDISQLKLYSRRRVVYPLPVHFLVRA